MLQLMVLLLGVGDRLPALHAVVGVGVERELNLLVAVLVVPEPVRATGEPKLLPSTTN